MLQARTTIVQNFIGVNPWANILVDDHDPEIIKINNMEANLGQLPDNIYKIRDLITRHEVCHFKYKKHIKKIEVSIRFLQPVIDADKIGINHIHHGEKAWENDSTGRSLVGQQYVWAMEEWLSDAPGKIITPNQDNKKLGAQIKRWLGKKDPDKIRLVRLLLARLTWDWKSYEVLQQRGIYKEIETQICSIDICHYAFRQNIDRLLHGIAQMKPVEKFEGCGSFNKKNRHFVEMQLSHLNKRYKSLCRKGSDERNLIRAWLVACLMKTLKEQAGLSMPIINLED